MRLAATLLLEFLLALFQSLLELVDGFVDKLLHILRLAEGSVEGVREAGLLDASIDASLVEEGTVGQESGGPDVLVGLDVGVFDELFESLQELLGWVARVMSESHDELTSLGWLDLLIFNEVHDGDQTWVSSRSDHSITKNVLDGLLQFGIMTVLFKGLVVEVKLLLLAHVAQ